MIAVSDLEVDKHYVYRMYNSGKKRVQEYPVVFWGKDGESYIFNMLNVEGQFRLTAEQVIEYIRNSSNVEEGI